MSIFLSNGFLKPNSLCAVIRACCIQDNIILVATFLLDLFDVSLLFFTSLYISKAFSFSICSNRFKGGNVCDDASAIFANAKAKYYNFVNNLFLDVLSKSFLY